MTWLKDISEFHKNAMEIYGRVRQGEDTSLAAEVCREAQKILHERDGARNSAESAWSELDEVRKLLGASDDESAADAAIRTIKERNDAMRRAGSNSNEAHPSASGEQEIPYEAKNYVAELPAADKIDNR